MKRLACFAAVLAIGCVGFLGCNKDENKTADTRTPGQKAGDTVQHGVDATTQGASNAATQAAGAASHGLPELSVPLAQEGGLYKIDVPDSVDGKVLHDNLLSAIKDLQGKSSSWPDDKAEAYREVSHRILMAVLDKK